jgi:hypothetical protein
MFRGPPDELVATELAAVPETPLGQVLTRVRRLILGPPLHSAAVVHERMPKLIALPVLSSDLLSSVAYGPEAMLAVLVLAGGAALRLSLPIAAALVVLMVTVGQSYRQTIRAYPTGAGSYIVASANLGPRPGLAAAAGLVVLIHLDGIVPRPAETVLSQLGRRTFHSGPLYAYLQATTSLILLLAANTAFNDFPGCCFSWHATATRRVPSFAWATVWPSATASSPSASWRRSSTRPSTAAPGRSSRCTPSGCSWLAFTLSQTGMVVHWWRTRGAHWRQSIAVNGCGALLCALVLLTAAVTKFAEGAWVILVSVPLLVLLALRIYHHYATVRDALSLHPLPDRAPRRDILPARVTRRAPTGDRGTAAAEERQESPVEVAHLILVPIARLDLAALRALAHAASLGQPVLAVHISPDEDEVDRFYQQWRTSGDHLPVEIITSPYRAIVAPLVHYLEALHTQRPEVVLTVVVPEIVVRHRWHEILHSHVAQRLRRALRPLPGFVIASVPIHLKRESTGC